MHAMVWLPSHIEVESRRVGTPRPAVLSVQAGAVAPLGKERVSSGFVKKPVAGSVSVTRLGLVGDAQADLSLHGGPEKAVYGYAASNYTGWRAEFPEHAELLAPGAFGENLTIGNLDETGICVGDVHRIGTAVLQICQPRMPCYKFAIRFQDNRMPRAMVRSGRAGWYYRVLERGVLGAGDRVELMDRPQPAFPFARLVAIVSFSRAHPEEIQAMAEMPELASALRAAAQDVLREMR